MPQKSTLNIGIDVEEASKLPHSPLLQADTNPSLFYVALADSRIGVAKGYCPYYIGRDPLLDLIPSIHVEGPGDAMASSSSSKAPRSSSRPSTKGQDPYEIRDDLFEGFEIEAEDFKTTTQTGQKAPSRAPVTPSCFSDLPTELLVEILRLLEPWDLLYICGVTTHIRDILNTGDAWGIWKSAYLNDGMSPPFWRSGHNPLHYTGFLYDETCQFCDVPAYAHRRFPPAYPRSHQVIKLLDAKSCDPKIVELCRIVEREVENHATQRMVIKGEYLKQKRCYTKIMTDCTRLSRYIADCKKENRVQKELEKPMLGFRKMMKDRRATVIPRRLADIRRRLGEEGYARYANFAPPEFWHGPPISIPRELTQDAYLTQPTEWPRIRAECLSIAYPNYVKDRRKTFPLAFARYLRVLQSFLDTLTFPQPRILPSAIYFAQREPFISIIKRTDGTRLLIAGDFRHHEQDARRIVAEWREETDKYLVQVLLRSSPIGTEMDVGTLSCADLFFGCEYCDEPIAYPRVLWHRCFKFGEINEISIHDDKPSDTESCSSSSAACIYASHDGNDEGDNASNEPVQHNLEEVIGGENYVEFDAYNVPKLKVIDLQSEWQNLIKPYPIGLRPGYKSVYYHVRPSERAMYIIIVCGENPLEITHPEMTKKRFRLECLLCDRKMREHTITTEVGIANRSALCMSWTRAIVHSGLKHAANHEDSFENWRLITSEEELAQIRAAEENLGWGVGSQADVDGPLERSPPEVRISTRLNIDPDRD